MKGVVTVVGPDNVGIIAKVCAFFAERDINIRDISQTVTSGYFNMMMIVDVTEDNLKQNLAGDLGALGEKMGLIIRFQHEDIFKSMHRI